MHKGGRSAALALLLVLAGATCSTEQTVKAADAETGKVFRIPVTVQTETGPVIFQAEIADDPAERTRGLMFRESMDDDHGMLFLFPQPDQLSFWMRNTLIPLDIIFIKSDRTILGVVENAVPETTTSRMVPGLSQFVLEINGGRAAQLGIRAGQKVTFLAPVPDR